VSLIDPMGVYSLETARQALGLRKNSLSREIREKRLQVSKRCGRYYIRGIWLIAWLDAGRLDVGRSAVAGKEVSAE
jgi:hypothetical protein